MMERPAKRKWFELSAPLCRAELIEARLEVLAWWLDEAERPPPLLLADQSRMRRFLARSEGEAVGLLARPI